MPRRDARLQDISANRLLWLEAGSTAARRPREREGGDQARLAMLANDPRPRAFGEEARWRYQRSAALVALHETAARSASCARR